MAGGEEKSSPWSGDEGGVDANGSSESESGISMTDCPGALRRLGVAGAVIAAFVGDLARFGDAAFALERLAGVGGASFLGLPRSGFSAADGSLLAPVDFFLPRLRGARASAVSDTDVTESFLGLPRGRFSGCGGWLSASQSKADESFLGRPLGRVGDAACKAEVVDMVAWAVLLPKPVLFWLAQHWLSSAIMAVRFLTTLNPYEATSFASRASV